MKRIAIIGTGAYGSYAASLICELHPEWDVHMYEIGDETVRDQDEMGLYSEVTDGHYGGLKKGRYFGFGGATNKWGGQILTFSDNDFRNPSRYQKEIVELNKKYRQNVFKKVGIRNDEPEQQLQDGMFTKTGVWLDYFNRNLFKKFAVRKQSNVTLHPNHRVCRMLLDGKTVIGFETIYEGKSIVISDYDYYFLAAGAFETTRILMVSGVQDKTCVEFSDHINKKVFRIKSGTKLGPIDFTFHIKGASFITKRVIGERNGVPFFVYPTYNEDFPFFQNLKKLLFGRRISPALIWSVLKDIPSFVCFLWYFVVLRKLYVYKSWYLVLHIENYRGSGKVSLSQVIDSYGQPGVSVKFGVSQKAERLFDELKEEWTALLDKWNVEYEQVEDGIHTEKFEDEYHPCGLYSDFESVDEYFSQFDNMLVMHSGVLPHAGGINSTAAGFPLIEEFVRERMKEKDV